MTTKEFRTLSGATIPAVGFGTWQLEGQTGHDAVVCALRSGYRMVDCAFSYFNQKQVGEAINESSIPRSDLFIVDKLANTWHTHAEECLLITLKNLNIDYLDAWLMHWPSPLNHNGNDPKSPTTENGSIDFAKNWDYIKTWNSMIKVQEKYPAKVKEIGVANFGIAELEAIINDTGVSPTINQVELHPSNRQKDLHDYCVAHNIQLIAYSPLGSVGSPLLKDDDLMSIAKRKNISVAQLLLSWGVAMGWPVIPRSQNPERIIANLNIVELTNAEIKQICDIGDLHPKRYITAPWHTFDDN